MGRKVTRIGWIREGQWRRGEIHGYERLFNIFGYSIQKWRDGGMVAGKDYDRNGNFVDEWEENEQEAEIEKFLNPEMIK